MDKVNKSLRVNYFKMLYPDVDISTHGVPLVPLATTIVKTRTGITRRYNRSQWQDILHVVHQELATLGVQYWCIRQRDHKNYVVFSRLEDYDLVRLLYDISH